MAQKQKKRYTPEQSHMFIFGAILAVLAVILFIYERNAQMQSNSQSTVAASPTISPQTSLLVDAAVWYPSAPWSPPKKNTQTTYYGNLPGESIQATVTSNSPSLDHFEIVPMLKEKGFLPDNNLAADGPGSSSWGYKKTTDDMSQVMVFSYQTQPTSSNPNEPLQFTCPCKITITAFVSNPFSEK